MIKFTILSRSYCHLCDDMLHALEALKNEHEFEIEIEVVDVDADEGLMEQYDELVPVLLASKPGGDPVRLCHYFLDVQKVRDFLIT